MSFLPSSSLSARASPLQHGCLWSLLYAQRRLLPVLNITRGAPSQTSRSAFTPITRQTSIKPGYEKVAATPTETILKESRVVPQGYSVDFLVDPHGLVEICKERLELLEERIHRDTTGLIGRSEEYSQQSSECQIDSNDS